MSNPLVTLFFEHRGKTVDKWEQYLAIYANEFAHFLATNQPVRLLEIGVQNGGSLELWAKYLPQGSEINGIDIDPKVGSLNFDVAIIAYVVDAADSAKMAESLGSKVFDVIIDNGSHRSGDIIATFNALFDRLAPGGKYIVEDLHASYWASHGGGFRDQSSAVEFFKNLVDSLNVDHFEPSTLGSEKSLPTLRQFGRSLARVTFYDSVAVIEKLPNEKSEPYRRIYSGLTADVVDPFIGVAQLPTASIKRLLFNDEQKRRMEIELLKWLDETRERNLFLESVASEAFHAKQRLLELEEEVKNYNFQLNAERSRSAAEIAQLKMKISETPAWVSELFEAAKKISTSATWRDLNRQLSVKRLYRRSLRVVQRVIGGGRSTSPAGGDGGDWERTAISAAGLLDERWYLQINKDVAAQDADPLDHYLAYGSREGRNPNRLFDTAWYLRTYPDVAEAKINPLAHYAAYGAAEGRDPHPDFSTRWYLEQNPDVAKAGINPLAHFLHEGWPLGLPPFSSNRPLDAYRAHFRKEDVYWKLERHEAEVHIDVMIYRPQFLILIDGDNVADRDISEASCRLQVYPDWKVVNSLPEAVESFDAVDQEQTYFIWMPAGDRLDEKALYACASALNADSDADLVYFDEDQWDGNGRREPFYKPDWSPDYLESLNYIGPAACFRVSKSSDLLPVVESLFDFTLRFVERTARIVHVRQILMHRKLGLSEPAEPGQIESDERALQGRLQRTGRVAAVVPNFAGFRSYDVKLKLKSNPLVSIIIPTAGKVVTHEGRRIDLIVNCIEKIVTRSSYKGLEFVIVDNGDLDASRLKKFNSLRLRQGTFGEAKFNVAKKLNIGAGLASGQFLLLMNDDVEPLAEDWIERMLEHFEKPDVGVVGAKLLYSDLTTQHVGVVLNSGNPDHVRRFAPRDDKGYFFSSSGVRNFHAVTGAVMMTPAARYKEVGGYTEALAISFNDVDYCLKVGERGYSVLCAPKAELIHFESQSRVAKLDISELTYFYRRWAAISTDRFYNEDNLTVAPPTFNVSHNTRII